MEAVTMAKSKKTKRVMTCSKCGMEGFNSRNCPTKTHPWTALTMEEVSKITSVLGIDKTEISDAQIAFAISKRNEGETVEPLAWYYHTNASALNTPDEPDTNEDVAKLAAAFEGSDDVEDESEESEESEDELSSEEMLVLSVGEDELIDIKQQFDSEVWYLCTNDAMKDNADQLCPTSAVGNSTIEAWTEAETGYITFSTMIQINGKMIDHHIQYTEEIPTGEELAKDFIKLSLSKIEAGKAEIVEKLAKAQAEAEAQAQAQADAEAKAQAQADAEAKAQAQADAQVKQVVLTDDSTLVGFETTETGYKLLFNGPDGFVQGEKDMGFSLAAQLGFDDVERLVMSCNGELRLCAVPSDQIVLLENMKPNAIPFSLWETLDFDPSDSEHWLTSKLDEAEAPILLGVRKAPTGKTWVVKAVCVA